MSWRWGSRSRSRIESCHPTLRDFLYWLEGRTPMELTVTDGFRGQLRQNTYFAEGKSRLRWPDSNHNNMADDGTPASLAADIAPWITGGIPWDDVGSFLIMDGMILQLAQEYGIALRVGSDWDQDYRTTDTGLMDPGHIELAEET